METKLMLLPECPTDKSHGQMILREESRMSYEQKWSGVWYDCSHCSSSVLYPSKELQDFLDGGCR
jgi:hypothetical protein